MYLDLRRGIVEDIKEELEEQYDLEILEDIQMFCDECPFDMKFNCLTCYLSKWRRD